MLSICIFVSNFSSAIPSAIFIVVIKHTDISLVNHFVIALNISTFACICNFKREIGFFVGF